MLNQAQFRGKYCAEFKNKFTHQGPLQHIYFRFPVLFILQMKGAVNKFSAFIVRLHVARNSAIQILKSGSVVQNSLIVMLN